MSNDKRPLDLRDDAAETSRITGALDMLSQQYGRAVLLLDPYAGNHMSHAVDALTSPPAHFLRLDDPIFKSEPQSAPLLVELLSTESSHQDLLVQSILRAQEQVRNASGPHSVCGWLFTDVSLPRLQQAMRKRLDGLYPGGARIYLRYFDPRVMPRLSVLLDTSVAGPNPLYSNLSQLLGPVRTWCHLNREGVLQRHDNPPPEHPPFGGFLRFDQIRADAIDRIGAINLTARALIQRAIPCKQSDDAVIDTFLIEAQERGLHDTADLVAYAWRAMHFGARFTSDPMLDELITAAATHGIPFDALVENHTLTNAPFDSTSVSTA